MFLGYATYTPILVLYVPDHWCSPNPKLVQILGEVEALKLSIPVDHETGKMSQCHMYDVDPEMVREKVEIVYL